ncbi:MAG TPA: SusC/RagA family TonB-linked outer membrane protein [Puia sp.]|jgi:TonB-linked SusC/RagA family outer membrane protein
MGFIKTVLLVLLSATCLLEGTTVYCQSTAPTSFTLTEKNASLQKTLTDIQGMSGYTFVGEGDWPKMAHLLSFSVKNVTLKQLLDTCFRDQPLTYTLKGTAIIIGIRPLKEEWVHGYVQDTNKQPLSGATVYIRGSPSEAVTTKENGEFRIRTHYTDAWLVFTNFNFETRQLQPEDGKDLIVQLKDRIVELTDVSVMATVHTGYQTFNKETATGSFSKVDNELVNRRVDPYILNRMDGVTSSVLFNKNLVSGSNASAITIRGRSTIFANPDPLIVIDNFPYSGDVNNINPDDVESITVLKDAAAASIWGAFSGNGVIVITTKKGRYNQAPRLSFNTSLTVGQKPNLYYQPILSSNDYIDVEQYLFHKGFYNQQVNNPQHLALSPAVEILYADSLGQLSHADAQTQLDALRGQDTRRDLDKYFYRHSLNQQYSLQLAGGGTRNQYFLSAGYDRDLSNLVRNEYNRITLNGNNTYCLVPQKLEISTGLSFTSSKMYNNNSGTISTIYPYSRLADANGNALSIPYQLRASYADTAGGGQLLDWHYRPLDELRNADNTTGLIDYRLNIGARYTIRKGLNARVYYQYGQGSTDVQNYQSQLAYSTRYLINEYTQPGPGGTFTMPIPLGGIFDDIVTSYQANNIRGQLYYDDSAIAGGILNAIAGAEMRDVEGNINTTRLYGYTKGEASSMAVDYVDVYSLYSSGQQTRIPYLDQKTGTSDRFVSYYTNAAYTYRHRYILSASARRDESNLFGVKANQKGVPLWSVGGAWEVSKEDFYHLSWLPFLKLRVTNGYNGNVDRNVSAFTTANINNINNIYGATNFLIVNPPNPSLRWERVNILNAGIDFSTKKNHVGGSLEYYIKSGKDLIGQSPVDPTTGVVQFTGNTSDMRANGIDLTLHTNADIGRVHWNSVLLFSFVRDRVTTYKASLGPVINYFYPGTPNPLAGHPLYSVYAFRWAGLDPQTGDPRGWLDGKITNNYNNVLNSSDLSNLVYKGPANPPYFGSWRNSFNWNHWEVSFNIVYKLGYFFRRNSISYTSLFSGISHGHPDYERRWQKPGDELYTNVPSMTYPANLSRDNFYQYSEVLLEKGDHIRLQDLQLSYDILRNNVHRLPVRSIRLYGYANNIGILWRANHQGIDPDYIMSIPNPRTLALGVKVDF